MNCIQHFLLVSFSVIRSAYSVVGTALQSFLLNSWRGTVSESSSVLLSAWEMRLPGCTIDTWTTILLNVPYCRVAFVDAFVPSVVLR
jgi:hypothetical protein